MAGESKRWVSVLQMSRWEMDMSTRRRKRSRCGWKRSRWGSKMSWRRWYRSKVLLRYELIEDKDEEIEEEKEKLEVGLVRKE
jgi:hypothetical protein